MTGFDAAVVGAGPNGLAAAVELARSGRKVLLVEGATQTGGGTRTAELTLPGFHHDVCSAIHPSGLVSPFFRQAGVEVDWVRPPVAVSHPLDGGGVAALLPSLDETASRLGEDGPLYRRIMGVFARQIEELMGMLLGPVVPLPEHKLLMLKASVIGGLPASVLVRRFSTPEARGLISGLAAHSVAPLHRLATSGVGLALGAVGHAGGWPLVRGGSQRLTDAMVKRFVELGGVVETNRTIERLDELSAPVIFLDVMPPAALRIGGNRLSLQARRRLERWKPGPGVFKVDWALDGPVPWSDPVSSGAGTVHVGGTFEEIHRSEKAVFSGEHPERPFVLLAQQSLFDPTRAPSGKHTLWGYCHVPTGSTVDMTKAMEGQIERFAPGFKDLILAKATMNSPQYQAYNPNLVGGDIGGGKFGIGKVLQVGSRRPYDLGGGVFLCSSAVPPGAGVHGMCGYNAVRAAIGEGD